MSDDHNNAPHEHTPEGAIPTPDDGPRVTEQSGGETMIGDRVDRVIDTTEVERQIAETIGEGEPLPVGANDPLARAEAEPPGMPHQPDDLDREMAYAAHQNYLRRDLHQDAVRLDSATVPDAILGRILNSAARSRNVREALLRHIGDLAYEERIALSDYARSLRIVQEARDAYVASRDRRFGAIEALMGLGLDVEGDHDPIPEEVGPTVSNDVVIV